MEDRRGGGHWVGGVKFATGRQRTEPENFVPRHHHAPFAAEPPVIVTFGVVVDGILVARARHPDVGLDDLIALAPEGFTEHAFENIELEVEQPQETAEQDRVLHDGIAPELLAEVFHRKGVEYDPRLQVVLGHLQLIAVVQDSTVGIDLGGVLIERILVQGHHQA
jgi:hypothetical protein